VRLIDSHAHLQAEAFGRDGDEVIAAARTAGVERFLVPGWDADSSLLSAAMAAASDIDASAGIHPHAAAEATDDDWALIERLAGLPRVVAIGETGLDYDRGFSPRDVQLTNLRRHLALARDTGKPVILHCRSKPTARDAQDDLIRELVEAGAGSAKWPTRDDRPPALLHSFSGPVDFGQAALSLGLAISFSGLTFRAGEEATAFVARLVPGDRLLAETDSPYLSPPGAPHRRNEPLWVEVTTRWLAEVRGASPDVLGEQLVANYDRIFR